MDDVDIRIAEIMGEDGRISNREIARRIGVSEGTVRQRVNRLLSTGAIRISAEINLEELHDKYLAVAAIKLDGRHLEECAAEIDKLPGVQSTMIVTGQYDLLVTVMLDSRHGLVNFVTRQLSQIQGVRESETLVVLKTYRQWVPVTLALQDLTERKDKKSR